MSVRRSVAWAFSGQFLGFVVGFAGSIAMARLLSPQEMGIYAIALAAQGILSVFVTFSVNSYIIRETELRPETLDTAFTINALLAAGLSTLLVVVSFGAEWLLGDAGAGRVMLIYAICPLLSVAAFRASAMLQREMQFKTITLIDVTCSTIGICATVTFAVLGQSYMSPAYGALLSAVISVVAYAIVGRQYFSFRFGLRDWRPITTFGLRIMSVSGVAMIGMRLSDIVVGRVLGLAALGLYGRASNLSNLIFSNIYGTATRVLFIQLAAEFRETGDLRPGFVRGLQMITAFMWPLLAGLAILARPVIYTLYGEKWLGAAQPLSILLAAQFIVLGFAMNWELFVLRDETKRQSRYEIARSIAALGGVSIGALFSIAGAALGRVADAVIGIVLYYPHVRRLAGTGPGEITAVYRTSAMLTVVAVLPALVLMLVYDWSARTPVVPLLGSVVIGVTLWLGAIFGTNHPLRAEIELLARKLAPGRLRRI